MNGGLYDVFISKLDGNLSAGEVIPTPTPSPSPTPEPSPSPSPTPIPSPTGTPTAITLAYFYAKAGKNGRVTLTWEDADYYGKITLHGPEKVRVGSDNTSMKRQKRK